MVDQALFSSDRTEWETPQWLWDELDLEFDFDIDAAATESNAKVPIFYTKEDDSLSQPWYDRPESVRNVWVNPPYGRGVGEWVKKAYIESQKGATVVMLLAARTDTSWFHDWILGRAEVRFLRGRLVFEEDGNPVVYINKKTGKPQEGKAPFPSMIVIYRPPHKRG